jgi:hypothetical protein
MLYLSLIAFISCALQSPDTAVAEAQAREWLTPTQLQEKLVAIVAAEDSVTMNIIGNSRDGHPIQCIQIAREGFIPIEDRSAILLVAGIDGDHLLGSEVASDIIEVLLNKDPQAVAPLLQDHVLYIIPQVNPDVASRYFAEVKNNAQENNRPVDNDHDGELDEDDNDDLNGDGFITMMRVPDLEKATHIIDPEEPRLNKTPNPFDNQAPAFVLYSEGIDNDGDGAFNEDGQGGVHINKNFMHGYTIHGDGAGPWQLSEPESKALINFAFEHQEIAAILVYGHHDTLSRAWGENGNDKAGAPKKLHQGDVELYSKMSDSFVEITGLKGTAQPNWDGSFVAWAYAQFGVPSFSTPLWARPEPTSEETKDNESEDASDERNEASEGRDNADQREVDAVSSASMAEYGNRSGEQRGPRSGAPRGGSGGPPRGGAPRGGSSSPTEASSEGGLTPSGIGDISQETLDELLRAAEVSGYPVTDEMMQEISASDVEQFARMAGVEIRRVKESKGKKSTSGEEAKWLQYSDDARESSGFIPWETFDHPQLGPVEIGGWKPYFKILPPIEELQTITEVQADFLINLASKLPDVSIKQPLIKNIGKGLWEIKVAVENNGWLPAGTAMAKQNKRARPYVVRLNTPNESILNGQKVRRIWTIDGGGNRIWFTWIIQGKTNSPLSITLYSEKYGVEEINTTLVENVDGGGI